MTAFDWSMNNTMEGRGVRDGLEVLAIWSFAVVEETANRVYQGAKHAMLHIRGEEHIYNSDESRYEVADGKSNTSFHK